MDIGINRRLDLDEFEIIRANVNSKKEPNYDYIKIYKMTFDDIAKINKFHFFYKDLKKKASKTGKKHNVRIITREEANELVGYLIHFKIYYLVESYCIAVLERDENGYEARPDFDRFYYEDAFYCKNCGTIVAPFEKICKKCNQEQANCKFDPII